VPGREFFQRYLPLPDPCRQVESLPRRYHPTGDSMPRASPLSMQPVLAISGQLRAMVDLAVRHPLGRG
jgi:hypothetical protein